MSIKDANISVTGDCGLIGSMTRDLILRNYLLISIVIFDNLSRGASINMDEVLKALRVKPIREDIWNKESVQSAMQSLDAVIHMAALRITACAGQSREAMKVMRAVESFNVVEAAQAVGVRKAIASSSGAVYGTIH